MIKKSALKKIPQMNDNNLRFFKENFGVTPDVMLKCWNLLIHHGAYEQGSPLLGIKPKHLIWTCLFLKVYGKEGTHCALCKCDPKTYRLWVWKIVRAISKVEPHVVS